MFGDRSESPWHGLFSLINTGRTNAVRPMPMVYSPAPIMIQLRLHPKGPPSLPGRSLGCLLHDHAGAEESHPCHRSLNYSPCVFCESLDSTTDKNYRRDPHQRVGSGRRHGCPTPLVPSQRKRARAIRPIKTKSRPPRMLNRQFVHALHLLLLLEEISRYHGARLAFRAGNRRLEVTSVVTPF